MLGQECLRLLRESDGIARIVVLTRRPPGADLLGPKTEARTINFDRLTAAAPFFSVDTIICALGTTMKKARTHKQFRAVNLLYPLTAAHLGIEKSVSHFLFASVHGADAGSRSFFNRTKGELEDAVKALPYHAVTVVRPSALGGKRKDRRIGEQLAGRLAFLVPAAARPISATDVAAVLVHEAVHGRAGTRIFESVELPLMAASLLAAGGAGDSGEPGLQDLPRASVA